MIAQPLGTPIAVIQSNSSSSPKSNSDRMVEPGASIISTTSTSNGQTSTPDSNPATLAVPASPTYHIDYEAGTDAEKAQIQLMKDRRTSMILGVTIGVPLGLIAVAFVSYIVHRHLKLRAVNANTSAHFPPDPIDPFATRIIARAELDTQPNAIAELDGNNKPSEVDGSEPANARRSPSALSELEGSQVVPSDPSNRVSVSTTANEARFSNSSSLVPPSTHRVITARASVAASLQSVGQESLLPPRPHVSHRLSRPTSGHIHAVGVADGAPFLTRKFSIASLNEKSSSSVQQAHESKQAELVNEKHGDEQDTNSEKAHRSDEATTQDGGSTHVGEDV